MLETETVLDRRRLRRSVSLWRAAGLAALLIALGAVFLSGDKLATLAGEKQIARVTIEGTITEDRDQLKMLKDIADDNSVSGVLLFINSPGGTTTGGEALYEGIRTLAQKKPVVAQFGTVAASAAYIAGLATDHIVARGNSITGSVGVIVQWPEVVQLLDKIGVKMNEIKSGPLKASPSPFEPLDDASKKVAEGMVADGFKWFVGLVETRRGVKAADIPGLLEGRIFSGREALEAKLVDQLGGEDDAVNWLKEKKNVPQTAKVTDWKPGNTGTYGFAGMSAGIVGWLFGSAAGDAANFLLRDRMISTLGLDGLLSVWHPSEK
ncbi:signal peptide peptidase SppA [Hyphomicrobium sp.]|uniref:signal peptide peptidase SppA n=1 Tax=Hyphomicrobium sp. TaxID=82 RepID=UPI000F96A6C9|nr:signal peptide peptidase SppA [Hyphomicrobium sp.]RUP09316.1 MAG: signal peptide peptidase SppA [Hyphomicrobium sp.]